MKFFITGLLLLSSLTALAANEVNIEVVVDEGLELIHFRNYQALYIAANPTCQEMIDTHFAPIPVRRQKSAPFTIEDNKISAEYNLGGFCQYKLNDLGTELKRKEDKYGV